MSQWTHVTGTIRVDVHKDIEKERFQKWLDSRIALLPKITGSERDVDMWVKPKSGYNHSTWEDNEHKTYQTMAVITIDGDLRDRNQEQVLKEVDAVFDCITKNLDWYIDMYSIKLDDILIGKDFYYEYHF